MKLKMIMASILPITYSANSNVQYITPTDIEKNQPKYDQLIPFEFESRSRRDLGLEEVEDTSKIFCLKNGDMFCNPANVEWNDEQCTVHRSYSGPARSAPLALQWPPKM